MKLKRSSYLLIFIMSFLLIQCTLSMFAQGTNNPPAGLGALNTPARPLHLLMPLIIPLAIALLKAHINQIPSSLLPILAPLLAMAGNHTLQLGLDDTMAAVYGLAGVGVREVKDQSGDFFSGLLTTLAGKPGAPGQPVAGSTAKTGAVRIGLLLSMAALSLSLLLAICFTTGCVLSKKQVVTAGPVAGTFTTNTVVTVNQLNLSLDCSVFEIAATPLLTKALLADPAARPIVVDVRTAVDGLQNGVNTNTMTIINSYAGKNAALDKQLDGLVQKVSDLRGQLLVKWGASNAGIIEQAVAGSVVRVCDASLLATQ